MIMSASRGDIARRQALFEDGIGSVDVVVVKLVRKCLA